MIQKKNRGVFTVFGGSGIGNAVKLGCDGAWFHQCRKWRRKAAMSMDWDKASAKSLPRLKHKKVILMIKNKFYRKKIKITK